VIPIHSAISNCAFVNNMLLCIHETINHSRCRQRLFLDCRMKSVAQKNHDIQPPPRVLLVRPRDELPGRSAVSWGFSANCGKLGGRFEERVGWLAWWKENVLVAPALNDKAIGGNQLGACGKPQSLWGLRGALDGKGWPLSLRSGYGVTLGVRQCQYIF